jgi:hypothetical protein
MLTHSFFKNGLFSWAMQKIQKTRREKAYFITEFGYFYISFLKPLRGYVGHRDLYRTFLFEFFNILTYVK